MAENPAPAGVTYGSIYAVCEASGLRELFHLAQEARESPLPPDPADEAPEPAPATAPPDPDSLA